MAVEMARRPITVEEYFRMAEVGIIGFDERVELVEGELIVMPPPGGPHSAGTKRLLLHFSERFTRRAIVHVQDTLIVSDISAPEPDVALLAWDPSLLEARNAQASDVLLLVEVADSSRTFDRRVKRPMYARAGVPEYWILDLVEGVVEVHRRPRDGDYDVVFRARAGETLALEAFPEEKFAVDDLLHAPKSGG